MELEEGDHRLEWEKDEDGDPEVLQEPNFRESTRNKYSKELRDLVLDCTKYEQSDRPTPVQVFDRVKQYFARQSAADPEGALRSAPKDDPIWNRPNFVLDFVKDDKWPLWGPLVRARLPDQLSSFPRPPDDGRILFLQGQWAQSSRRTWMKVPILNPPVQWRSGRRALWPSWAVRQCPFVGQGDQELGHRVQRAGGPRREVRAGAPVGGGL